MAALIPKNSFQIAKKQSICATSVAIQMCNYSTTPRIIKNPTTASLKRGTGGRSSFNGIVCTVFGNTGFYGRYVCNRLGKIGTQLILPYRGDHYDSMELKLCGDLGQVLFHPFDLRDEESILRCVKHSNVVINLIGRDWETKNFSFDDVHVKGARTLARICKKAGVERFIHVSCLGADPNPKGLMIPNGSKFFKSKWAGECAVKEEFPDATIVKPAITYGQEDRFLCAYVHFWRRHMRSIPLWKKGEETEKQPVWVSDVAAGITAIVKDPDTIGKTYQFTGPKRYKLSELVDWFHRVIRKGDDYGYRRLNIKLAPLFQIKVTVSNALSPNTPIGYLHWEALEKEFTSEKLLVGVPSLEDLGVYPIEMEAQVPWELKPYRANAYYNEEVGEIPDPEPPKSLPLV